MRTRLNDAVVLFGPASVLLSAVGPVAVRLQVRALPSVGRTAGRTFAISTAGSIVGTFVTAFWLIPELGIEQLFVFAAAAPLARRGMKAHYVAAESMGFGEFVALETAAHGTITASADCKEAFSAFVEKRTPRFQGK